MVNKKGSMNHPKELQHQDRLKSQHSGASWLLCMSMYYHGDVFYPKSNRHSTRSIFVVRLENEELGLVLLDLISEILVQFRQIQLNSIQLSSTLPVEFIESRI